MSKTNNLSVLVFHTKTSYRISNVIGIIKVLTLVL